MSRTIARAAVVFLLPLACAGSAMQIQEQLGDEFATSEPTSKSRSGWQDDVYPQQVAIDRMRLAASQGGAVLLAAAFLRTGVHPYIAAAFVQTGDEVRVIQTQMYWGSVRSKAVSRITAEEAELFLARAESAVACRADATLQDLEGAALIVWPNGGGQRLCSAAWFSTEAATLGELLSPILGVAEATYSSRDE